MGHPRYTTHEICERGEQIYQEKLRAKLDTPENYRKVVVLDIETGEYEMDSEHRPAAMRAKAAHPDGALYAVRIGFPAVEKIGGGWGNNKNDQIKRIS